MPKFTRTCAAIGALALVGGVSTAAAAATPEPTYRIAAVQHGYNLKPGPILAKKYGFNSEPVGTIQLNGQVGICYDYGKQSPDGRWATGSIADVPNAATRVQMQFLVNKYWAGALRSDLQAAALKGAVNRLRSAEFRSDWKASYVGQLKKRNPAVVPLSDRMLSEAKSAGPVSVKVAFVSKPTPGVAGLAVAAAKGNGRSFAGQAVTWSVANAAVTSSAKSAAADGTARLRFVPTGAGAVKVTATLVSPEWRIAGYSIPSSGRKQHLIRGAERNTVRTVAAASYDSRFGTTVTQDCSTTCDGKPPITFTAKAGANALKWEAVVGKTVVGKLSVAAGKTAKATFTGRDGQHITFRYAVKVAGKWSGWRTSPSAFDVVCPAWPVVTMTKACACKGPAKVTYTFASPGDKRFRVVTLTIDGTPQAKTLTGKQSVTLSGPIKPGSVVVAEFVAYADAAHTTNLSSGVLDGFTQR